MENRRRSLLDNTRNNNFLRKSFGCGNSNEIVTITREEYLTVLKKEHQEWKNAHKAKPRKLSDIVVSRADAQNLKEEDKEFLQNRPNYPEMIEEARCYVQSINYYNKLAADFKRHAIQRLQILDQEIHDTVSQITAEVDELCSKCNNEFCTKEIHYLVENFDTIRI